MATQAFHIAQLWLDVDRPIQPRAPRGGRGGRASVDPSMADRQMELRMVPPAPRQPPPPMVETPAPVAVVPPAPAPVVQPAPDPEPASAALPFAAWLLDQTSRRGTLGELAKAAKLDRQFPRMGDADAVRARFSAAGADGDAFEALDDAELEYGRAIA